MSTNASPRIATLSTQDALAAAETVKVLPQIAELNVFRTLLKHPKLAKAINDLLLMLLFDGNCLPHRLRELLIMRIGWVTGCDYEWTQHWRIALDYGLTEDEVLAVRDWRKANCFDDADQAVLRATDETLANGCISRETWMACAENLESEAQLLELNGAIGAWRLISQLARSVEIQLEEGVASWPPDGLAPTGA
ncbi:MAG: carboxymuconolactone decarboxylase family protein [Pseudomonadales bacterium]|jgi:alkylhydroperoxidase family enzyme|nr:carboxymuconolactone decarboxylase family protein [Pseudomonadales bacterium]MDP6472547.1 carboxymuconolactone decarboxylase family protein [Pseudomonadales bacterium]MDP6829029.1 carboxymuconolactone decarboxylase family protein [Pseudomonadales bacterium]MDP6969923.1 carboxymuconolactone decarboxylase family protein [Pseudomonadales bacterium]|tara:strand:+ start:413 stop:994 length:582 start_codon:yes stop_codon:yes gene_type:complete